MTTTQVLEYELPYLPVPFDKHQSILDPIRDGLLQRRFDESSIRRDYIFTSQRKDKIGLKVHQAAFTDPQRWDPSTSGVNFYYYPDDTLSHSSILENLAISGAPFNLIGGDDLVSLYIMSQDGGIQIQAIETDIAYEQVPQLFARYNADIAPQRIRRAKQGMESFVEFHQFNPLQLRLFAVHVTEEVLVEQFSAAVHTLRNAMRRRRAHADEKTIAVQLLAAVILAHKGVLGEQCGEPDAPLKLVIEEAYRRFPNYFTPSDIERYNTAAKRAFAVLQRARYGSFTPDILEALWRAAYLEAELRKWEGRYNTPLYLTHRILENIPVETIPPAQRIVADMTCGVGNFLQAAYERLSKLTDMQDSGQPLRGHIFGNDKGVFTAQLAGLSLLLTSHADRWHIDHQDALQWNWLSQNIPTIIVGNPPFSGSRKLGAKGTEFDEKIGKPKRYQKADAFLERAIQRLAPGGYLAMVMPQSFGVAEASPYTRKLLLEQCDVLEIWELPNEVFTDVTVRPMVLFAQRKPDNKAGRIFAAPVRVRTVQCKALDDFKQEGVFTASRIAVSQKKWGPDSKPYSKPGSKNTHLMKYRIILSPRQWLAIERRTCKLDEVAYMTQGAIVGSKSRRRWTDYKYPKEVKWLSGAKESMPRPYYIRYGDDTKIYPNEFEEPRKNRRYPHLDKEYLLAGDKVLLVSDPDPTWGQRVKAAIERRGYYPSDSFWVLAPKWEQPEHITLEVLAAVLSWYVSNTWIVEHLKAPKVPSYAIKSIPFPRELSAADCQKLESAVRQLEAAAQYDQSAPDAQRTIDQVLKEAYQLGDTTFERLRMVAEWEEIDPATLKKPRPNPAKLVSVTGGVEDVDAQNGMITLWLNGFTGLHTTCITDEMPGWMLRPGAAFRAEISEENYRQQNLDGVAWVHITPQEYTYLTEDELLEHLDASFSETSSAIATPE
jgi:hypothetical protein